MSLRRLLKTQQSGQLQADPQTSKALWKKNHNVASKDYACSEVYKQIVQCNKIDIYKWCMRKMNHYKLQYFKNNYTISST